MKVVHSDFDGLKFTLQTDIPPEFRAALADAKTHPLLSPTTDSNRARWPQHKLWDVVTDVIATDLGTMRSCVVPDDVKDANRTEHMRMPDAQILGLLPSGAAAGGVTVDDFDGLLKRHPLVLRDASKEHAAPLSERLAISARRYRFR